MAAFSTLALFLVTTDQIAELLAVIGVIATGNSGFDPFVLGVGQCGRLAYRGHRELRCPSYYWCIIAYP